MNKQVIQDWTKSEVHLNHGARRDVKYSIFKEGEKVFSGNRRSRWYSGTYA